jgi:PAS domain S-box-containing protein
MTIVETRPGDGAADDGQLDAPDPVRPHGLCARLAAAPEARLMLHDLLRTVVELEGTEMGLLSLCAGDGPEDYLVPGASLGFPPEFLALIERVPPGGGACGTCFQRRQRVVVEDTETDPIFAAYRDAARQAGFRAVHSTPLMARGGEVLGVLSTHFRHPHRPSDRDQRLVDLYARQAVDLIENLRLSRQARDELAERRRAERSRDRVERHLRTALETIPAGAYTCDADGMITQFNRHAVQLWGREPKRNDPVDRFCGSFKLFAADGRPIPHDACWMALALRNERDYLGEEIIVERPDGDRYTVLAHARPIHDEDGRLLGAMNVLVDITEHKRMEQALREADRRKDEFLAMLAHELRNPLAAIANARLVAQGTAAADEQEWAEEVIDRQLSHLSRMIDDLLDVSRITRGKIRLRVEPLEVLSAVNSAVEAVRPLVAERKHELTVTLTPGALLVRADPTRLEQVVVNLLTNAAKYTPSGGHIRLNAGREAGEVVLRVRDDGMGIPPEMLPKMFELFAQGERSIARSEGGLGIGLTIVRKLVELHGGTIAAASEGPGRGSEFVVRLPAIDEAPARAGHRGPPPAAAARPARILVVDDNADTARGMARLLKLAGHEVWLAGDGREAIELALAHRPGFVLLDIGLPVMDGYEVARRLRDQGLAEAVIVAISGYGQDEDRRRSREAGINHHLVKPVDPDRLLELLAP